jgi:peroxin-12
MPLCARVPQPAAGGVAVPADRTQCPLCRQPRTNPALIPSGYVFCFPCIYAHVESHGQCPVTLAPTAPDAVRKLYIG